MENIENRDDQWLRDATAYLTTFMTPERVANFEKVLSMRTRKITLLAENTFHSQNASALVRHCDAFGIQGMHAVESLCRFTTHREIVKGTDKWIDVERHETTLDAIKSLKSQGYSIVATSPHINDTTPEEFDVTKGKIALVFGTEHAGISEEVIEAADQFIRIPMHGMVESLNVSASAAIIIYQLAERLRQTTDRWQLDERDHLETLYKWCFSSVKDAASVLERAPHLNYTKE